MTRNKEAGIFFWLIVSFSVATFLYRGLLLPPVYPPFQSNDFRGVFYPRVKTFLSDRDLYPVSSEYFYPPLSVVLIAPFTLFPVDPAEKMWFFTLLACLGGSFFLLVRSFPERPPLFWALFFFLFSQFEPLYVELAYYQIDLLILLILVMAYRFEEKGFFFWSGFCLAIGSLIKIMPAFFLLYFLMTKKWKSILGFFGGLLFGSLVTVLLFGMRVWPDFFLRGVPRLLNGSAGNSLDQSFTNILLRIQEILGAGEGIQKSSLVIRTGSLIFSTVMILSLWSSIKERAHRPLGAEYAAVICAMLLSATTMNETHLVLLLFPFSILMTFFFQNPGKNTRGAFFVSLAFTIVALHYGYTAPFLKGRVWGLCLAKAKFFGTVLTYLCCLSLLTRRTEEIKIFEDTP